MKRVGVVAALGTALLPAAAAACPYCASRDDGGIAGTLFLAAMIVLPFLVAAVVVHVIRRGEAARDETSIRGAREASPREWTR